MCGEFRNSSKNRKTHSYTGENELRVADFGIQSFQVRDVEAVSRLEKTGVYPNIDAIHLVQVDEGPVQFFALNMTEESDGTNSYFKLAGIVKNVLDPGGLFIADEMDAHLHPLLTKHLVMLFNSQSYNPKGHSLYLHPTIQIFLI